MDHEANAPVFFLLHHLLHQLVQGLGGQGDGLHGFTCSSNDYPEQPPVVEKHGKKVANFLFRDVPIEKWRKMGHVLKSDTTIMDYPP